MAAAPAIFAYTLQALGTPLRILASVGEDFAPYQAHLDALGVDTGLVRTVPGQYTAQCFITSDQADNQITAFHPGAMDNPPAAHPADAGPLQLAISRRAARRPPASWQQN